MMSALVVIGGGVTTAGTARAGLTLGSSSGVIDYGVFSTASNSNSPNFNGNILVYPGGGLPVLQSNIPGLPTQSTFSPTLSPDFSSSASTVNTGNGSVPPTFGTATTDVFAATSGQQGAFTSQGGIFYSVNTQLTDNLSARNQASVAFAMAVATFTNNTGSSMLISPGAVLSVVGRLDTTDPTSFVAAGLRSSFTTTTGDSTSSPSQLDSVILAAGTNGVRIASTGSNANEFGSVTVVGGMLTGTGTSLYQNPNPPAGQGSNQVNLVNGESITLTTYLTLISDPGSSIGIAFGLPAGFPAGPQFLPDFGAFADSAPMVSVPEPSAIAMLGAGLAMAGVWARPRRGASSTAA